MVRDAKTTVQGKTYDLINDQFYIMIAAGDKVHRKYEHFIKKIEQAN